jgi:hypothetical protein
MGKISKLNNHEHNFTNSSVYFRPASLCAARDMGHLLCKSTTNTNTSLLTVSKETFDVYSKILIKHIGKLGGKRAAVLVFKRTVHLVATRE